MKPFLKWDINIRIQVSGFFSHFLLQVLHSVMVNRRAYSARRAEMYMLNRCLWKQKLCAPARKYGHTRKHWPPTYGRSNYSLSDLIFPIWLFDVYGSFCNLLKLLYIYDKFATGQREGYEQVCCMSTWPARNVCMWVCMYILVCGRKVVTVWLFTSYEILYLMCCDSFFATNFRVVALIIFTLLVL